MYVILIICLPSSDIPDISMCMVDLFSSTEECSNIDWLADVIIRGFVEFVGLGECAFKVEV